MTIAQAPSAKRRPSAGVRRVGYLAAIAANAVALWAVHRLLVWGWPGFLTPAFEEVLPLVSASLIVSMLVNAGFVVRDQGRVKAFGDLLNAAFGVAVSLRMWTVFPFDFTGYGTDWTLAVRIALVVGIVATSIAVVVGLVKIIAGDPAVDGSR